MGRTNLQSRTLKKKKYYKMIKNIWISTISNFYTGKLSITILILFIIFNTLTVKGIVLRWDLFGIN